MPDESPEKVRGEKIIAYLQKKWGGKPCPMCQVSDVWSISPRIFELREFAGGNVTLKPSPVFPVVTVMCKNCGCTFLLNAVITDLLD